MARVKLVAESIQEYTIEKPVELNEEELNESYARKWEKLDKDNEEAVRKFASNLRKDVKGSTGLKVINSAIENAKIESLKDLLNKAAKDKFKGFLRPSGKSFVYRPAAERKVKSEFEGGGTQGKTQKGGV